MSRLVALSLLVLAACGPRAQRADELGPEPSEGGSSSAAPSGFPSELVVAEEDGPAIFLDSAADAPAIGYLAKNVRVRVAGPPVGDRLPVRIAGPIKVRGWIPIAKLAARVLERGRVRGTPTYVGPNDLVRVIGGGAPGTIRVEVRPWLGRAGAADLGTFVGEIPASELGAAEVDPARARPPSPGQPHTLPVGQPVPVYDRPNGTVVATLPALDPPLVVAVLRDRSGWKGIRAGVGPYLVGYVNIALTPGGTLETAPPTVAPPPSTPPRWLAQDTERTLHRVAPRTRIYFNGVAVAVVAEGAYAREMNRFTETNEVDVFVSANDDVAIRGMVAPEALSPAQ